MILLLLQLAVANTAVEPASLRIEPWGANSIRVRAAPAGRAIDDNAPGALDTKPPSSSRPGTTASELQATDGSSPVNSGVLSCSLATDGRLQFSRTGAEAVPLMSEASVRAFDDTSYPGVSTLSISFSLEPGEKIWGLGQTETNYNDLSGQPCLSTAPENGHILIPLAHSSRGYSFLINLPSFGKVCIDAHDKPKRQITWFSRGAFNFDLWVTTSASAHLPEALKSYVEVTGKPTPFPVSLSANPTTPLPLRAKATQS
jgi:alpha-D-xyloside xylohydrolase